MGRKDENEGSRRVAAENQDLKLNHIRRRPINPASVRMRIRPWCGG
jgi:hypothetical protein